MGSRCYRLARDADIRVPRFFAPKNVDELNGVLRSLDFRRQDYVIKANVWEPPTDPTSGRYTKVLASDIDRVREQCLEVARRTGRLDDRSRRRALRAALSHEL